MDIKHRAKQVSGGFLFLVGCGLLLLLVRPLIFGHFHFGNIWSFATFVLLAFISVYLVCSGLRMVSPGVIKPSRFGWGKVILGLWILNGALESNYAPPADGPLPLFKPSNPTQAVSMKVTAIFISLIGLYLIFRGIRAGFAQGKSQPGIHATESAESTR